MKEIKENRITEGWMNMLRPFIGEDGNAWAINKEQTIEEEIIKLLDEIGIQASVKTDKHSLPVTGVVSSANGYDSYIPYIFSRTSVKRKLLKEILNADCRKIRFYVYIYTTEFEGAKNGFAAMLGRKFHIEVRYYLHKNREQ